MNEVVVVWFRQDLRLQDHKALHYAIKDAKQNNRSIIGVFHIHPALNETFTIRHDYFFSTLASFTEDAKEINLPIHFLHGDTEQAFRNLLSTIPSIQAVYFNLDEVGFGRQRDDHITVWLEEQEVNVHRFVDAHIHGAEEVKKPDGGFYQVFTPYYRRWSSFDKPSLYTIDKQKLQQYGQDNTDQFSRGKEQFQQLLNQCQKDWNHIGERSAVQRLSHFLRHKVKKYEQERDFPAKHATSMISPYLKNGVLSPRTVYQKAMEIQNEYGESKGLETFVSEIAWRDFYNMVHYLYPNFKKEEVQSKYQGLDWNEDEELFDTWKKGETGFPIVDAAMKQINEIGWMHNRLRMVVASFLTKDYLIDWRKGERYFADHLIDYDPSSNIGGWQWAASTGTDAVPYFRVFNPTRQSERFDPDGEFIKAYIPELTHVPKKYIHEPSKMTEAEQERYGCIIGKDYPKPTVNHKTMRKQAIAMFENNEPSL
ncbi:cryptochrome/photolyase family protein [Pontibacillus salicampi]|uniref:Cryptochrome/photolyase family protein n=1 Tax=Pontibacillus salicampi TaxID=1449801 RepID=A0ABV6LRQ6_9BACI